MRALKNALAAVLMLLAAAPAGAYISSFTWAQSDWTGGVQIGTAAHAANQTNWTGYDSQTGSITVTGAGLRSSFVTNNWTTTNGNVGFTGPQTGFLAPGFSSSSLVYVSSSVGLRFNQPGALDFNTADYAGGIPGITKLSNTTYTINTAGKTAFFLKSFTVGVGSTVIVTGPNPLIVYSSEAVTVAGVLVSSGVRGSNFTGGAGGAGGFPGANFNCSVYRGPGGGGCGTFRGGGGGFGGRGGSDGGMSGESYSSVDISSPLIGGSGGGTETDSASSAGSGGGGAIGIISRAIITVSGTIDVRGGGGAGGGGSGGAIRLISYDAVAGSGNLIASGGSGCGEQCGAGGGGGRVYVAGGNSTGTLTVDVSSGPSSCAISSILSVGTSSSVVGALSMPTTGFYMSPVFDTGGSGYQFGTVSWSSSTPDGSSIVVAVRAGNTAAPDGTWTSWTPINNGDDPGVGFDNRRYVQWQSSFTSAGGEGPEILDLTIGYGGVDATWQALVSNVYDTAVDSSSLRSLKWSHVGTGESNLQLRTSPDAQNWTPWMGPGGTSASSFTLPGGGEVLPSTVTDSAGDRYFQYKLLLKSVGAPGVSVTSVTYGPLSSPALGGMALISDTSTQMTINFDDWSREEDGHHISTGTSPNPINIALSTPSNAGTKPGIAGRQAVLYGLTPNTRYYIRARAYTTLDGAMSPYSNEASTYTRAAPPTFAGKGPLDGDSVNFYWNANGNPAGTTYQTQLDTDPGFTGGSTSGWDTATDAAYNSLTTGVTYYMQVRARNENGAPTDWVYLGYTQPTTNVTNFAFNSVWVSSVSVSWNPNGNLPGHRYRVVASTGGFFLPGDRQVTTVQTSTVVWGLNAGTTYNFTVQACSMVGLECIQFTYSNNHPNNGGSTITLANVPINFSAPVAYDHEITLDWGVNGNSTTTLYNVRIATDPAFGTLTQSLTLDTTNTWRNLFGPISNTPMGFAGGDHIYYFSGGQAFGRYSISGNTVEARQSLPVAFPASPPFGASFPKGVMLISTGTPTNYLYTCLAGGTSTFLRYSIPDNQWDYMAYMPAQVHSGGGLASGGGDFIYAIEGYSGSTSSSTFMRYSISRNTWTIVAPYPASIGLYSGMWLVSAGDGEVYYNSRKYSVLSATWTSVTGTGTGDFHRIMAVGRDNFYVHPDANPLTLQRYSRAANAWSSHATIPLPNNTIHGFTYAGGSYLYASHSDGRFWRYSLAPARITGLSPLTTYYVQVAAVNSGGTPTSWVSLGSVATRVAPPVFSTYTAVDGNNITVNWTTNDNPADVRYYFQLSLSTMFTSPTNSGAVNGTAHPFSGLAPSTTYYIRGWAEETAVPGNVSYISTFPVTGTIPATPSLGTLTVISSVAVGAVWGGNGNPAGTQYNLEYSANADFSGSVGTGWIADLLSSTPTALTPNTAYYFRVQARSALGVLSNTAFWPNTASPALAVRTRAAPPTNPSLSNVTGTTARFNWSDNGNPGGTAYWVGVGSGTSDPGEGVSVATAGWISGVTNRDFAGLSDGATYWFRIKARNADSIETAWTTVVSTTLPRLPIAPSDLSVDLTGVLLSQTDRVYLRWTDNSSDETGFELERSTNGYDTWTAGIGGSLAADTTCYLDFGLANAATRYYYRVRSIITGVGSSGYAAVASTWTRSAAPGSVAFYGGVGVTSMTVNWAANGNPNTILYEAELSTSIGFAPPLTAATTDIAHVPYAFTGLAPDTTYYFRVRALNGAGIASDDAGPTPTNWRKTGALAAPSLNSLVAVSSTHITAAWTDNSPSEDDFYLSSGTASPPTDSVSQNTDSKAGVGGTNSRQMTALYPNTRYYVRLRSHETAYDAYSTYSQELSTYTLAATPAAVAFGSVWADSMTAVWTANGNPAGTRYIAQLSTAADFSGTVLTSTTLNTSALWTTGLVPGTSYYLRARALNEYGAPTSTAAPASCRMTRPIEPGQPASPYEVYASSVVVRWGAATNAATVAYRVQRSSANLDFPSGVEADSQWLAAGVLAYQFSALAADTTYYFRVAALNAVGDVSGWVTLPSTRTVALAAPTLNSLFADTSSQITVSWTDNSSSEDNFSLSSGTASEPTASVLQATLDKPGVGPNSRVMTALYPNTLYYVRLRAHDAAYDAYSTYSQELSTYTLAATPAAVAFGSVWASSMTAVWTANGNPAGTRYIAQLSTAADFSGTVLTSVTLNTGALWTAGLVPGTSYYLRARALNEYGAASSTAAPASCKMTRPIEPGQPASPYDVYASSVVVRWGAATNAPTVAYRVQRSYANTDLSSGIDGDSQWLAAGVTSYAFDAVTLTANATYYFQVAARNAAGDQSAWVMLPSTQTLVETPSPAAADVFVTSITAHWGLGLDSNKMVLAELSTLSDFSVLLASSDWTSAMTSYPFTGLTADTRYFIRVRAKNGMGVNTPNVTLHDEYTRAAVPAGPLAPYGVSGNGVDLRWSHNGNVPGFTEYYAVLASTLDFSAGTSSSGWTTNIVHAFSPLASATTYYFRVKARNHNASPLETGWFILPSTPTSAAPAAPSGLAVSYPDSSPTKLRLDWSDNASNENGFNVYRSTDLAILGDPTTLRATLATINTVAYLDLVGLSTNTLYYYKVGAYHSTGEAFSNTASTYTLAARPGSGSFSGVGPNALSTAWDTAGNPAGTLYVCQISSDSSGNFATIAASSQTRNAQASFTGLTANATYYARVRAVNGWGNATSDLVIGSTLTLALGAVFTLEDLPHATITQGDQAVFARLRVTPTGTGMRWTGLPLSRIGTGDDQDVSRLSVYRDGNGDGVFQAGNDTEVGWGTFSGGNVAIALSQTIDAPTYYFLALRESDTHLSWPENTIGFSVGAPASPNSTVTKSPSSFSTSVASILKLADTLTVTGADQTTAFVSRGQSNVPFLQLSMLAARDRAYARRLTLRKLGTLSDTALSYVKIYRDTNDNGLLDVGAGDDLVTSGTDLFVSSQAVLSLLSPATHTVTTAGEIYFVTLDLPGNTPLDTTVGVRLAAASDVVLMAGTTDAVSLVVTPTDSGLSTVSDPSNVMNVAWTSLAPLSLQQGQTAALLKLDMNTDSGSSILTQIKLQRSVTSIDSDYSRVALHRDSGNGTFSAATDPLITSGTFSGGELTFVLSETISQSPRTYFLTAGISPTANTSNSAGFLIQSGFIRAASAQTSISATFNIESSTAQITPTIDTVLVTPNLAVAPGFGYQGDVNVPLLALQLATDANAASLGSLTLQQAGSALDADLSALRIYRDNGDGLFNAGADALITSNYSFSSGVSTLSFSSPQTVTVSPSLLFIAADVAASAVPGRTVLLRLAGTSAFGVTAPDSVSGTFPILSNTVALAKPAAVVLLSTASLAPASAQAGTADISMLRVSARTNLSWAQLNALSLQRAGGLDSTASEIALHWDANSDGILTPDEKVSSGVFAGGLLTLGLGSAGALTTTAKDFYLTLNLSAGAVVGSALALSVVGAAVASPDGLEAGRTPFTSGSVTVAEPPSQLTSAFESKIATSVVQGASGVLVASMTFGASAYSVDLTGLRFLRQGTGLDADAQLLRLYRDNGNGTWGGAAEETPLGTAVFSGGLASFGFTAEHLAAPQKRTYFLAADISNTAVSSATFGVAVPGAGYLTVADPDVVASLSFTGALALIEATHDTMLVDWTDMAPSLRQGDVNKVVGRLSVRSQTNSAAWSNLTLDRAGTALDSDISALRLYKDDGNGTFNASADTLVGQTASPVNGRASLLVSPAQTVSAAASVYFLALDVSATAGVGASFTLRSSSASFAVTAPDDVSVTGTEAVFSIAGGIADQADTVRLTFLDLASSSLYQGMTNTPMARLRLETLSDLAALSGLTLNLSGAAALSDLGPVKLWADIDGDGLFGATSDAVVATGLFAASRLTLSLAAPQALSAAPRYFFVTLDVPAAATVGNTVALGLADQADVVLSGVDVVEAFSNKTTALASFRDPRVPTPPTVDVFRADGQLSIGEVAYNPYETRLSFQWASSAHSGSVEQVYYAVGAASASVSSVWTAAGSASPVVVTGLNLASGSTYYLSIRAKSALGAYYSDIVSRRFVVDSVVPRMTEAPSSLLEVNVLRLSWPAAVVGPSQVAYYQIEERAGTSPLWTVLSTTSVNTLVVNMDRPLGTLRSPAAARQPGTYFYRISAVNGAGRSSEPSPEAAVLYNLASLSQLSGVSSYPNPFDSRRQSAVFNFTLNAAASVRVEIYNIFGGRVRTLEQSFSAGTQNGLRWDGCDESGRKVAKGLYLAVITSGDAKYEHKIGVIH